MSYLRHFIIIIIVVAVVAAVVVANTHIKVTLTAIIN